MNTIPTTFNEGLPSYTAVGGTQRLASTGLSAVILNRGGHHQRRQLFQDLETIGFDYIVSVESSAERYDLEDLTGRFPFVRFILPGQKLTLGEQINLAASELDSALFFVMWNDLKIAAGGSAERIADTICTKPANGNNGNNENPAEKKSIFKRLCTVPVIQNSRFETLRTMIAPTTFKKRLKTLPFPPHIEGTPSLYPFDGIGIYDRERFIQMGGFDRTLSSTHWQLMDFGFRAHLWGEEICVSRELKLFYDGEIPSEDNTAESSYRRFYFKNLAPVFRNDHAFLQLRSFFSYVFSSHADTASSWEDFSECKRWVKENSLRWKGDAWKITSRWDEIPGEESVDGTNE